MKPLSICLLLLLTTLCYAKSKQDYYGSKLYQDCLISSCHYSERDLKEKLHHIIRRNQRNRGYGRAKELVFTEVDAQKRGHDKLFTDVYCDHEFYVSRNGSRERTPNHTYINIEHTWPQSRFSYRHSKSYQKADMHHLYPSYSRANSMRGNFPFGEVSNDGGYYRSVSNCHDSYLGEINNRKYFEPPFEHRGNVARALFYFSVRYELPISRREENFLRKWHREDPVDSHEESRNEKIYQLQNNRNPFIDYPKLVNDIKDF